MHDPLVDPDEWTADEEDGRHTVQRHRHGSAVLADGVEAERSGGATHGSLGEQLVAAVAVEVAPATTSPSTAGVGSVGLVVVGATVVDVASSIVVVASVADVLGATDVVVSFAGEPVPRLPEVLALDALEVEVELKAFGRDFLARTVKAVEEAAALDRTELTSWNTPMMMTLKQDFPGTHIGIFSPRRGAWMTDLVFERTILGFAECVPADVVHVHAADVTASIVDQLNDRGHLVLANDAETSDEIRRAIDAGVDRLTTDDPANAVAIRSTPPTTDPTADR
jgi:hypothetical protein